MRLAVASDHGGFGLKESIIGWLREHDHSVVDHGPADTTSVDYPDYAKLVANSIVAGEVDCGVLVCGSGIGMSIAANKVRGIRAAVVQDVAHAQLAREHNDANVLCIGGRFTAAALACDMIEIWLASTFGGGRHSRRVGKIETLDSP